jgi:hypothetical protein
MIFSKTLNRGELPPMRAAMRASLCHTVYIFRYGCTHLKILQAKGCVGKEGEKAVANLKNFQLQLFKVSTPPGGTESVFSTGLTFKFAKKRKTARHSTCPQP